MFRSIEFMDRPFLVAAFYLGMRLFTLRTIHLP